MKSELFFIFPFAPLVLIHSGIYSILTGHVVKMVTKDTAKFPGICWLFRGTGKT